jgi:ferredoxin
MRDIPNYRLEVEMLDCDAYGYCTELLPELVQPDEWGYPIITREVGPDRLDDTRRAVAACPKLALRLTSGRHGRERILTSSSAAPASGSGQMSRSEP